MRKRFYILVAIGAFLVYSGLIEPNWIRTRTFDLAIEGLTEDVTVVHVSDIHTKRMGLREESAIKAITRADPDYVFVTGDLLKSKSKVGSALDFLASVPSRHGVYAVPGNGDAALVKALTTGSVPKASGNWRVLLNENVDCGSFTLVGLEDPVTCRDDAPRAFTGADLAKPIIVISHFYNQELLTYVEDEGADLFLCGHTHGGQIGLIPLVGRIPYVHRARYFAGLYTLDHMYLYVTRGVGTNLFPLRFFCRPEVVVFHLRGK